MSRAALLTAGATLLGGAACGSAVAVYGAPAPIDDASADMASDTKGPSADVAIDGAPAVDAGVDISGGEAGSAVDAVATTDANAMADAVPTSDGNAPDVSSDAAGEGKDAADAAVDTVLDAKAPSDGGSATDLSVMPVYGAPAAPQG